MFKHIFSNIITTLAGAFTGLPVLIEGIKTGNTNATITGFGVFLIGLLSKDANK
jgi:hypothetical protein